MRLVGVIAFFVGAAATTFAVRASFERSRPIAALAGLAAPIGVLVALAGALLIFVPDFFN